MDSHRERGTAVLRYAFYGRVSTEDQQDPAASRNWQRSRAESLIQQHGQIIAEFFDIGQSRSLPWKRRPEANALLTALKAPDRGFDAVVIGEPHRAFYGNQFGLVFPLFVHYHAQLWVPDVGGPIDPNSEAHDLIMSVFGGMSKGERSRIKIRVRTAMAAQAKVEGRYLGGRPPYGYRLADAGPHPNPAKAADGKRIHRLALDPATAPVVQRMFQLYLEGTGVFRIAEILTSEGIPSPSAADPARNRHRSGIAWSKGAVRAMLVNPRYTGYQVWNKQHKAERLLDVEDVALGYETRLQWNDRDQWVWSDQPAHPAIISRETFTAVAERLASRSPRSERSPRRSAHPYMLRGLVRHQQCQRKMQGNWVRGRAHYRCSYPAEYAIANTVDHSKVVYFREDVVVPVLDTWLASAFAPDHIESALLAVEPNQRPDPTSGHTEQLRHQIADYDRKLALHRQALEAGAAPETVLGWINDLTAQRKAAEAQLTLVASDHHGPRWQGKLSRRQIHEMVAALDSLLAPLQTADPSDKAALYKALGLTLTYDHEANQITATADPRSSVAVLVVYLLGRYLNRPDWLDDLRKIWSAVSDPNNQEAAPALDGLTGSGQVPRRHAIVDRLRPADIAALIAHYRAGVTIAALAAEFGISATSVKQVLRTHGVRRAARQVPNES
jgi:DNA invertase Pin-like site-specific DNA recombinase